MAPRSDNCPTLPNPTQADLDADGEGNACDPDLAGRVELRVEKRVVNGRWQVAVDLAAPADAHVALVSGFIATPFRYTHSPWDCSIGTGPDGEHSRVWPAAPGKYYVLAGFDRGASWDWGGDSFGTPRPQPSPACP